ncbi:MAG: hypothetical protein KAQ92_03445, partial [Candidatus Aenigmarchaeota archaeon]|nr:hypothetical protein [Candidatus Aenigmarchaeota archaeon]
FNKIFVKEGNIINGLNENAGVATNISFIEAIANKAAEEIEKGINKDFELYTGIVRSLTNINLKIPAKIKKGLETNNKKISIKGPVFVTIKAIVRG